ncbi:MAG TPA: hypothetical protein ENK54_03135 [Thiotrichales bacterium]|nr:hypothetical protein [Thiotrichales bacterium]
MARAWLGILAMAIAPLAAAQTDPWIERGQNFGAAHQPDPREYSAEEDVPGFETDNPPEARYYDQPQALDEAAAQAASECEGCNTVRENIQQGPVFVFDPETDPMLTNAAAISDAATETGLTGQYGDCQVAVNHVEPETYETCSASRSPVIETCTKTLTVEIVRSGASCTEGETIALATANRTDMAGDAEAFATVEVICPSAADLEANPDRLEARVEMLGDLGTCLQSDLVLPLDLNPHERRAWTQDLRPKWPAPWWSSQCKAGSADESGGCDPDTGLCSYEIRFFSNHWYTLAGIPPVEHGFALVLRLSFDRPRPGYREEDHWDGDCEELEARAQ